MCEIHQERKYHREDGPADIRYREDGSVEEETYLKHGLIHREDGPAWITYNADGSIKVLRYLLEDEDIGFWDYYAKVSSEVQKTILRVWLPYCHV